MTKKQEIQYWKERCKSSDSVASNKGVLNVVIPPNIPGLKRLHKKAVKLCM